MYHILVLDLDVLHLVIKQLLVLFILKIVLCTREHNLNGNILSALVLIDILLNVAIQGHLLVLVKITVIKTALVVEQIHSQKQTILSLFRGSEHILNAELTEISLFLCIPVTSKLTSNNNTTIIIGQMLTQMLNHIVGGNKLLSAAVFITKINNVLTVVGNLFDNVLVKTVIPIYIHLFIVNIHCLNDLLLAVKSLDKSHIHVGFLDAESHRQHLLGFLGLFIFLRNFLAERTLSICLLLRNYRGSTKTKSGLITHIHKSP